MIFGIIGAEPAKAVLPEDVLSDSKNIAEFSNGVKGRKGSVAAFIKNIEVLENKAAPESEKQKAIEIMKELASVLVSLNLLKHVQFKNPQVQEILEAEAKKQGLQ
jgi:hypothetical protein